MTPPFEVRNRHNRSSHLNRVKKLTPVAARSNAVIPVVVGGTQKIYVPNIVTAAVGDVVQFQFANGNHTVTQSAADVGCQPLQATVATAIHSGHIPFADGQQTVGTFNSMLSPDLIRGVR
jgi:plastocyanin